MDLQESITTDTEPVKETHEKYKIHVLVDYREAKLIDALTKILPIEPISTNLEIGDIQIKGLSNSTNSTNSTNSFTLLFERKAGNDLAASIKDHRYSEQKKRILSALPPHACTYILEGSIFGSQRSIHNANISQTILESAIIHTMYRDKMHVITTPDVNATASFIASVYTKCVAHPEYFSSDVAGVTSSKCEYASTLKTKTKKIENIDKHTCYLMQLSQIPGVSYKIAKEIATVYPTYQTLLGALHACSTEKEKLKILTSINMIANKKARTILEFIVT
jgi:ERCC4-type nuclease